MIDNNNNTDNDNDDNDNDDTENDNDDDTDSDICNHLQVPVCKYLQSVKPCYPFPINSVLLCLGEKMSIIIKMFSYV